MKKLLLAAALVMVSASAMAELNLPATTEGCQKVGDALQSVSYMFKGRGEIQAAATENGQRFQPFCVSYRRAIANKCIDMVAWASRNMNNCRQAGVDISSSYEKFQRADEKLEALCDE